MKILHVAESARGGVGTYLNELLPLQIADLGSHAVCAILPAEHRSQLSNIPDRCLITFRRGGRSPADLARFATAVSRGVRESDPTVIHAHSSFAGLVTRLGHGWGNHRRKIVYCPHGWGFDIDCAPWFRSAARLTESALAQLCDAVVAISEHELRAAEAAGIDLDKLYKVANGLSASRPRPARGRRWEDSRLRVLFIGRLDRQKGADLLFEAAQHLQESVSVRVVGAPVVGYDPAGAVPTNVELLGWLAPPEIEAQLALADVVVIPSRWEGFGLVALEAMRAAKPVLATRVGGLPDIVEDEVTGLLVEPESVPALTDGLVRIATMDRTRLGKEGLARFRQRFTIDKTHASLHALYKLLLGEQWIESEERYGGADSAQSLTAA